MIVNGGLYNTKTIKTFANAQSITEFFAASDFKTPLAKKVHDLQKISNNVTSYIKQKSTELFLEQCFSNFFISRTPKSRIYFLRTPNAGNNEEDNKRATQTHTSLIHANICSCFLNGLI